MRREVLGGKMVRANGGSDKQDVAIGFVLREIVSSMNLPGSSCHYGESEIPRHSLAYVQ
tara:strand:- start:476 stop:652 length:177 start_codon:yes stop_codon:yes gene_type:complete